LASGRDGGLGLLLTIRHTIETTGQLLGELDAIRRGIRQGKLKTGEFA